MKTDRTTADTTSRTPEFVSVQELARIVGLAPGHLRRLAREGRIPRLVLGHRTHRYPVREVIEALRADGRHR